MCWQTPVFDQSVSAAEDLNESEERVDDAEEQNDGQSPVIADKM